jgi:hypothetical protein
MRRLFSVRRPPSARRPATRLAVEQLEERQLLSAVPTDMTGVAQLFAPHPGPTVLYLNFDGGDVHYDHTWYGSDTVVHVAPFQTLDGQGRDQAIQDILFRVSERFAPFNVQVERLSGAGNYDHTNNGNTTVFVGANSKNDTFTPGSSTDYPGAGKGNAHQPNSDPYDIAFVSPGSGANAPGGLDEEVARSVAHEAGHTFGLAHVLDTNTDAAGNPIFPDLMNYAGATVKMQRFVNVTLGVTDLNSDPARGGAFDDPNLQPEWNKADPTWGWLGFKDNVPITTQNSYTYLQAVLGGRDLSRDPYSHVADASSVDSVYLLQQAATPTLRPGAAVSGAVLRRGDYDVYQVVAPATGPVNIHVQATPAAGAWDLVVLVYDGAGQKLLAFSNSAGTQDAFVQLPARIGQIYQVVVGAEDGASSGGFRLLVGPVPKSVLAQYLFPALPPAFRVPARLPLTRFVDTVFLTPSPLPPGLLGPVAALPPSSPAAALVSVPALPVAPAPLASLLVASDGGAARWSPEKLGDLAGLLDPAL